MKKVYLLLLIAISPVNLFCQKHQVFTLQNEIGQRIAIDTTINDNTRLEPFTSQMTISGLVFSGEITLHSDSSLVRIVLIDQSYNEYLIYETYPILSGSRQFSVDEAGEETSLLNNITPSWVIVELVDASIYLKEIIISEEDPNQAITKGALLLQQSRNKIDRINRNIQDLGQSWVAGETSISKLSYQEKKSMFGGRVPNFQGFEYYVGGVFVLPGVSSKTLSQQESPYADEFSWRNRHGQNWLTPVKNQWGCGSCWAFAATGATELLVNLYYNQHLDLDLSEQDLLSCSGGGSCDGGSFPIADDYIISSGIVNEGCFSYSALPLPCEHKCNNPAEIIKIDSTSYYALTFEDEIKSEIIKGATVGSVWSWKHAMALAGYKVLGEGDLVYSDYEVLINVYKNDDVCGKTAWLFKNSWGDDWGDDGYAYIVGGITVNGIYGPVYSLNYNDSDIVCSDNDGDGYYTWGIGPKPAHCPDCPDEPDGDDSSGCIGPVDEYGNITIISITTPPVAGDTSVIYGEQIPDLTAIGVNLQWYDDEDLSDLIHSGNSFATGHTQPGAYTYYVTQSVSECESNSTVVELTIINPVPPPVAEDVTLYVCEPVPDLTAVGENITWYEAPSNTFIDSRDGQDYKAVGIGNQRWMAENVSYYTPEGSRYYNNDSVNYAEIYGRLYNWETAQNVCPEGWHLPSDEEWKELEIFLGMSEAEADATMERGILEGGKLKERDTIHWDAPNSLATDEYGFTALPGGGYIWNSFIGINIAAYFWTSTPTGWEDNVYCRSMGKMHGSIFRGGHSEIIGHSVRCVKESNEILSTDNSLTPVFSEPGTYNYYVTQTINGCESYPDTVTLTINQTPPASVAEYVTGCEGPRAPDIIATGENIQWYDDADLSNLIHSGDTLKTEQVSIGTYNYYVTQTIAGCESLPVNVTVTLNPVPPPPTAKDTACCEGEYLVFIVVGGENITWYNDAELTTSIWTRNSFYVGGYPTERGENIFYVTQTINNCESPSDTIIYTINPIPQAPITEDVAVCENESIPVLIAHGDNITWYQDADSTFIDSRDGQEYRAVRIGNQVWMAENLNYYLPSGSHYYNNDSISYADIYGRLYNPFAIWKACPSGWHIPGGSEWRELIDFLGGDSVAAGKLKEPGYAHWIPPNTAATNSSGFTSLPAGYKETITDVNLGEEAVYWSSQSTYQDLIVYRLRNDSPIIKKGYFEYERDSYASVRCIKDKNYFFAGSGDSLSISNTQTGSYIFYTTQTISSCESPLDTVTLTINPIPQVPLTGDISVCEGEEVPDLSATGENIQWYTDSKLTTLVNSDNSFSTGQTQAGLYSYYVTQTELNCESQAEFVNLLIHSLPFFDLGNDTIVFIDQNITLDIGIPEYFYLWSNGSDLSYIEISGSEIGLGDHTYWVAVTDANLCTNSDSIKVTVIDPTKLKIANTVNSIKIYPNPARNLIIIETNKAGQYSIEITSLNGQQILMADMEGTTHQIDLSSFQKGVYFITIRSDDFVTTKKIIKY